MREMKANPECLRASFRSVAGRVDREAKALLGYVVAQEGPFKSDGRGEFDAEGLAALRDLGNANPKGLKSRFTPDMSNDGLGKLLGRAEPRERHRREVRWGLGLLAFGAALAWALAGRVDYWGASPAYVVIRLGGLLVLMRLVEAAAHAGLPGVRGLALLGHETLLVYVLHLYILFGGVFGHSPLTPWHHQLGMAGALGVLVLMLPVLSLLTAALVTAYGVPLSWSTMTFDNFVEVVVRQQVTARALRNSALFAATVSTLPSVRVPLA